MMLIPSLDACTHVLESYVRVLLIFQKQRVQKIFSTDKPHPWSSNNGRNAHGRDYIALNPVYSPEFVDSLQGDERRADRWRHPSANARTINRVRSAFTYVYVK